MNSDEKLVAIAVRDIIAKQVTINTFDDWLYNTDGRSRHACRYKKAKRPGPVEKPGRCELFQFAP